MNTLPATNPVLPKTRHANSGAAAVCAQRAESDYERQFHGAQRIAKAFRVAGSSRPDASGETHRHRAPC